MKADFFVKYLQLVSKVCTWFLQSPYSKSMTTPCTVHTNVKHLTKCGI